MYTSKAYIAYYSSDPSLEGVRLFIGRFTNNGHKDSDLCFEVGGKIIYKIPIYRNGYPITKNLNIEKTLSTASISAILTGLEAETLEKDRYKKDYQTYYKLYYETQVELAALRKETEKESKASKVKQPIVENPIVENPIQYGVRYDTSSNEPVVLNRRTNLAPLRPASYFTNETSQVEESETF